MPLQPGDKLGPYEILAPIGAGGMGEVYRARDTKLKRDVALKVLPEAFARDPERMARFQCEAEVFYLAAFIDSYGKMVRVNCKAEVSFYGCPGCKTRR